MITVKDFRCQVESVRPDGGASFGVDSDLGEEVWVVKGLDQGRLSFPGRELNVTDGAVIEEQPHDVRSEDGNSHDDRGW